ncbi:C45 family autoproteolytic acyltransferase/hydolase [Streptomyces sp. NBC_01089]|uniref:C45 family autoproteolytic acyltransferase/hydolase n=1 Tax=Streptomyces sp. NBC_01089 TaxID=2903747 RepID=UPI0038643379|nr:C45 family peptidase [Streptomyces sp. NBC_01089]
MQTPPIPLIEISGPPRERGRQYGEAARPQIETALSFYRESFARRPGLEWHEVTRRARLWLPCVEDFAPDLLEELRGVAEGAGTGLLDLMALNARGEIAYDRTFARMGAETGRAGAGQDGAGPDGAEAAEPDAAEPDADGCSSFALLPPAAGDGHVWCGQNWDWRTGAGATLVALRIVQPPLPTVVMVVEAGQIGRHGANSAGIALNANGLGGRFGDEIGVPQPFIRRRILDRAGYKDALQVPFTARQQIPTNLLLTHRDGVAIDLETTPARHQWLYPQDGLLVHGNHYQADVPPQLAATYRPFSVDSLYRVPIIEAALRGARERTASADVRTVIERSLTDHFGLPHSVCNHPDPEVDPLLRTSTIASNIVDLTTGEYHVSAGLPCEAPYAPLPWNIYDGPGGQ